MCVALKGPCKHKSIVAHTYKMNNFDILPKQNEKMRAFYYYLWTGIQHESTWLRPLVEEEQIPTVDWNEDTGHETNKEGMEDKSTESEIFEEEVDMSITASSKPESEGTEDDSQLELMAFFKKKYLLLNIQN
jgi:hypothetical protein